MVLTNSRPYIGKQLNLLRPAAAVAIVLLAMSGCRITGHEDSEDPPADVHGSIIVDAALDPVAIRKDRFDILDAAIDGSVISMTVSYSGGCEEHAFQLLTQGALILSIPPGANLYLVHEDNDDPCDAIVQERLAFDLTPLIESSGFVEILLFVWPFDLGQYLDPPLLYKAGG